MLGSLRVRLPLVFLAGIVLAGLVTTLIAVRLFQDYAHDQALRSLRREANGIAELYSNAINAGYGNKQDRRAPTFAAQNLEKATGDRIYFIGPKRPFPGQGAGVTGLQRLPVNTIEWQSGKSLSFELRLKHRKYLAVANPINLGTISIGAIVVATPKTSVRHQVVVLIGRFALAGLLGLVVAAMLAWYLSRRLVRPLLQLSEAADEVAGGNYAVKVPKRAPGELGHLSERFSEMTDRLAEAETMERNFLMSVSHELRTPLTAIRGHVEALREGLVRDEPASLDVIAAETTRLERLVGDVLDLAKLDAHRFTVLHEEVDMEQLVERAYAAFGEEARRRSIDYRREIRAQPVVTSDGDRVLQIISNLLANAFRWTPDGGRIDVELDAESGRVSVAVADTGPGIGVTEQDRIFRPFWSRDDGGTGLGLAIARELSVALGGRINLDSQLGRGSRFELVLPVARN